MEYQKVSPNKDNDGHDGVEKNNCAFQQEIGDDGEAAASLFTPPIPESGVFANSVQSMNELPPIPKVMPTPSAAIVNKSPAIAQSTSNPSRMMPIMATAELEKRKNEIVQEMLYRVSPFMNAAAGQLNSDVNMDAFAELMQKETQFVQRTLLLTILLNLPSDAEQRNALLARMNSSSVLLKVLHGWFQESLKDMNPLLIKLLELYDRLPLSVDQLVEYRLGKSIKKLSISEVARPDLRNKAEELCQRWALMARNEDSKRKPKTATIKETDNSPLTTPPVQSSPLNGSTRRRSPTSVSQQSMSMQNHGEDVAKQVAIAIRKSSNEHKHFDNTSALSTSGNGAPPNPNLFSGSSSTIKAGDEGNLIQANAATAPLIKSRAALILERLAKGEPTSGSPSVSGGTRPMSADDIRKAKLRQSYLADFVSGDRNLPPQEEMQLSTNILQSATVTRKRPKKRVSFANDADLVKIRYFEPEEEEDQKDRRHYVDFHEIDKNEASYAFKQYAMAMEVDIEWYSPYRLIIPQDIQGNFETKTAESSKQEQRERTALSATYFNIQEIPPSPSEHLVDSESSGTASRPAIIIPSKESNGRPVKPTIRLAPASRDSPSLAQSPKIPRGGDGIRQNQSPPTDFLNLLQNPTALQDILKSIGTVQAIPPSNIDGAISRPSPVAVEAAPFRRQSNTPSPPPLSYPSRPGPFMQPLPPGMPPMLVPGMHQPHGFPPVPPPMSMPMGRHPNPNSMMPPIPNMHSGMLGGFPPMPNLPAGVPPLFFPPPSYPAASPSSSSHPPMPVPPLRPINNAKRKTLPCKYYRPGRVGSCRNGDACPFIHSDN